MTGPFLGYSLFMEDMVMTDPMLLAPCGMNCSICSAVLRPRPVCTGCIEEGIKPKYCTDCRIRNCVHATQGQWCVTCGEMPCACLRRLDLRYRRRYGMSMIENIRYIREHGRTAWEQREVEKWRCPTCGMLWSAHSAHCLACGATNSHYGPFEPFTSRP